MEVSQYYRQQRIAATQGSVIARPSGSYEELSNLGQTFTKTGFAAEEQRIQAQFNDQTNNALLQIDLQYQEFYDKLDSNDTESWPEKLENMQKGYDDVLSKVTNEKAKAYLSEILDQRKVSQIRDLLSHRRVVDQRNFQRRYYENKQSYSILASQANTVGKYNQDRLDYINSLHGLELTEEAKKRYEQAKSDLARSDIIGNIENYEIIEDIPHPEFYDEQTRKAEARNWLLETKYLYDKQQLVNYLNIALSLEDGEKYIDSLKLTPVEKAQLKNDYERYNSIEKAKLKEIQDADKQAILDRFLAKQFEADPKNGVNEDIFGFINKTSLDPDEKEQWMTKARNWANNLGKDIESDVRIESELEKKALDISTGAVKREDFVKEVTDAAFGDKPKIDHDAFKSLMTIANREYKTYQANAMGEAIDYGLHQLISTDEELTRIMLSPEFTTWSDEKRAKWTTSIKRLESERYSQYKRSMNEWFQAEKAAGRDPEDDDIYVKSRKLAAHYRQRALSEEIYNELNPEELERVSELRGFFAGRPAKVGQFEGEKIKSPYEEYPDAFLEAGVWKVIRNGKKYRIED